MQLEKEITRLKTKLINKAKKTGLYENFGQKEVRQLEGKYINISDYSQEMNAKRLLINSFESWAMEYDG